MRFAKLAKADDDDDPDELADAISLTALKKLKQAQSLLDDVASDMGAAALAQIGVADSETWFGQVNRDAADYAERRAAALVTDIDESTRAMLHGIIADGIERGKSRDGILDEIKDSHAFSDSRAKLIADTEIRIANGSGRLAGYKAAQAAGVKLKKLWVTDGDPCDDCKDNEDAGPISLDEEFPSGADIDPGHPRCCCGTTIEVEQDGDDEADD